MNAPRAGGRSELSRRRLLGLAGTAGLAAALAACEAPAGYPGSARPSTNPRPSAGLTPPATSIPPPAPLQSPAAVSDVILCRDAWGAKPPRPGGTPQIPSRMTIHHTAVVLGDNSNAPARLRQHQRYHQDTHGWIDIAYHLSVDRNGHIYQLRDPTLVGDTATSYNPAGHFLVVCEGDFDQEDVTEEQLNGAALVFAWAAKQFNISSTTVRGHKDESSDTACPGASLYARLTSGDLQRRIDALLAAGPVELQPICGDQAAQIVANIETGAG